MDDKEKLEIAIATLKQFMYPDNWNYEEQYGPYGSYYVWVWCGITENPTWLAERALNIIGEWDE